MKFAGVKRDEDQTTTSKGEHDSSTLLTPASSPRRSSSSDASARNPCIPGPRSVPGTTTGHGSLYSRWYDGSALHDSVDSSAPWLSAQPGRVADVCAAAVPSVSPSVPHWHNRWRARPPGCPGEHATGRHWTRQCCLSTYRWRARLACGRWTICGPGSCTHAKESPCRRCRAPQRACQCLERMA